MTAHFCLACRSCEDCIDSVFAGRNSFLLKQVRLILWEEDAVGRSGGSQSRWAERLVAEGFERVWHIHDSYWLRAPIFHSAWQRGGLRQGQPSCELYNESARRMVPYPLTLSDVQCLPPQLTAMSPGAQAVSQ